MLLLIEQGNTNTVFGLWNEHGLVSERRVGTRTEQPVEAYAELLRPLLAVASREGLEAALISSVVPAARPQLLAVCEDIFQIAPLFVGEELRPDIDICLSNPSAVGSDRIVNAIGGYAEFGGPLLIVDSGTATKLDVVSAEGAFMGGIIAPGLWSSAAMLVDQCAKLAPTDIDRAPRVIGRDTPSALRSGLYWGHLCMIEGLIKRIQQESQQRLRVIATGGVVNLFQGSIEGVDDYVPHLSQLGMIELWRRTRACR